MNRTLGGFLFFLLGLSPVVGGFPQDKSTPAERYKSLAKEFSTAANGLWTAKTDEDRAAAAARGAQLTPRLLELVEENPADPVALDALVQVLVQVMWLENNTQHPGFGKDNPGPKAVAILLRDHI